MLRPIHADGGELTVLRSLAAFSYGGWDIQWPESTPDSAKYELPDDRRIGYVARLSTEPGTMGRRFIRRDVAITAAEFTDAGITPGVSDVDTTFQAAIKRTSGDAFVERELTREHLGELTPYVDFTIGDMIQVVIWGHTLTVPVVEIEAVTEQGAVIDWRVRVGGTLIGDEAAREVTARELARDLAAERRERQGDVNKARQTANAAKTAADEASQLAQTAGTTATTALQSADNKSTNYYGTTTPQNPKQGDTWFKETPTGTIIYQYRNNQWTQHLNTDTLNHELDEARRAVEDAAAKVNKLQDEELPQLAQDLARNKRLVDGAAEELKRDLEGKLRQLDTKLAKFPDSLADARRELDDELAGLDASLSALGSGNLFPDPHFQDACWGTSGDVYSQRNINGGELRIYTNGRQTGGYYQPKGKQDASMVLEPSAAYRLAVTAWRTSDFDGRYFSVYMRYRNAKSEMKILRVADIALTANGTNPVAATFEAPADMRDGSCTLGFYIQAHSKTGRISLWNMTVVRASDSSLITEGAVKTQHMVAGTIDGDRIRANTLHANRIVARSLTSQQIAADAIMAVNIAANQITAKQLSAGAVTADKIAANQVTAVKLAAGAVTADKLQAGSVTADKLQAGSVLAKHIKAGQVTAGALAAGAVSADKIAARALTSDKMVIANGFIRTAMVGDSQITNAKIANLDAAKITTGTLDARRIGAGSIDASKIKADSITVKELRAGTIVPLGASLIHAEPKVSGGVPEPIWWQVCDNELGANYSGWPRPQGHPWRMYSAASFKDAGAAPPKRLMKVQPGKKYRVRFWARATGPGSKLYVEVRDQNGRHAVARGTISDGQAKVGTKDGWRFEDHSKSRHKNQLVWNWTVPNTPTLVETLIEFNADVEYVYLSKFQFNEGFNSKSRTTTPQNQWLAGLSIDLDVVDQAVIDARQDETIARIERTMGRVMHMNNLAGVKRVENRWLVFRFLTDFDGKAPGFEILPKRGWSGYVHIILTRYDGAEIWQKAVWVEQGRISQSNGQSADGGPAYTANSAVPGLQFSLFDRSDDVWGLAEMLAQHNKPLMTCVLHIFPYE